MPEAVDPGIAAGFRAADQQSYLQQVLANTRATQQQSAQLKAQQEQQFFDPESLNGPDVAPDEFARRKTEIGGFASGATKSPDGRDLFLFKDSAARDQALTFTKTKSGERQTLAGDKGAAAAFRQSAMADLKMRDATGKLRPEAERHLQVLEGGNVLDPNREASRKTINEWNQFKATVAKGGQPVDQHGNPIGPANVPERPPTQFDVAAARAAGHEVSTHQDKEGNLTYSIKETVDSGDSLNSYVKANFDGRTFNALSPDEKKAARAAWKEEQRADKGKDQALKISVTNEADAAKGVGTKEVLKYYSYEKGFAADIPGMEKMNHSQLVQMGFYNRDTGEGAQKFAKNEATFRTAEEHIMLSQDAVGEIAARRPDLYPDWDPAKPSTSVARAKAALLWRTKWLDGSDPDVSRIMALDHAAMRLQAALNPTGTRFGLGMLYYAADGSPTSSKQPVTKQSVFANIDTWKQNMFASRRGIQMSGQRSGVSPSYAPPLGQPGYIPPGTPSGLYTPPTPPSPPSAGVSGSTGFKKWMEKGGGR